MPDQKTPSVGSPEAAQESRTKSGLTTLQLHLLDAACVPVRAALGYGTYLVGTAETGGPYRDVDVRVILPDEEFDRLFADKAFWTLVCASVGWRLSVQTSLPVDFQIQRQTEANERYSGPRNPLGTGRVYAGGGDATPFDVVKPKPHAMSVDLVHANDCTDPKCLGFCHSVTTSEGDS